MTRAGTDHPPGPGTGQRARLYGPTAFAFPAAEGIFSAGNVGRVLWADRIAGELTIVFGYAAALPEVPYETRDASLLEDARGIAFDPVAKALELTEHPTSDLRTFHLDPEDDGVLDAALAWTNERVSTMLE